MSSEITVKLKVPEYIKLYLENRHGEQPFKARDIGKISHLITKYLQPQPVAFSSEEGNIEIEIPFCSEFNVMCRNYLPERAKERIKRFLRDDFDVVFIGYMQQEYLRSAQIQKRIYINKIIYKFIDEYGLNLDDNIYATLVKKYYRYSADRTPRKRRRKNRDIA